MVEVGEATATGEEISPATEEVDELLVEDLLVQEVSIDGMCGVY